MLRDTTHWQEPVQYASTFFLSLQHGWLHNKNDFFLLHVCLSQNFLYISRMLSLDRQVFSDLAGFQCNKEIIMDYWLAGWISIFLVNFQVTKFPALIRVAQLDQAQSIIEKKAGPADWTERVMHIEWVKRSRCTDWAGALRGLALGLRVLPFVGWPWWAILLLAEACLPPNGPIGASVGLSC